MVDERSKQANRTSAGRWTAAVALFAGTVTVLAACGGGATVSSEPVVRGAAYSVGSTGPGGGKVFYVAATPFVRMLA